MINSRLVYISIILSGILLAALAYYPDLDIKFSALFYDDNQGFIYRNNVIVRFLFLIIPLSTKIFFIGCFVFLFFQYYKHKDFKKLLPSSAVYLIIAALLGPGLIVNHLFKNNFGRARPSQIIEFDGSKTFTKVLAVSDQCAKNCSFSSGHAAMAYYYTALAYVFNRNKKRFSIIYIIALLFGTLIGFIRILMGGHFLSDVLASCFIILIINHLLYYAFRHCEGRPKVFDAI